MEIYFVEKKFRINKVKLEIRYDDFFYEPYGGASCLT